MKSIPTQLSDNELIRLIKKNKETAFEELFYRYENRVFLYAFKLTSSKETAEELLQDIFVKIWGFRDKIDETKDFSSLLFRIAKNHILNFLRNQLKLKKEQNNQIHFAEIATNYQTADENLVLKEYTQFLDSALKQLPHQRYTIYKMSRENGMSYGEIAADLGISVNTVRIQIVEALKHIRQKLKVHLDISYSLIIIAPQFFF